MVQTSRMSRKPNPASSSPAPPPPLAPLLTTRETSQYLRRCERTVRSYVRAGLLRAYLIGGAWRFRREDIGRFLESSARSWELTRKSGDDD